jgi:hypothetical protein
MKKLIIYLGVLALCCRAYSADVTEPQSDEITKRYESGDIVKKMAFDINGDGVADQFFTIIEANPDPTTKIADAQNGGSVSWEAYVSNPNTNTFKVCDTLEEADAPDGLLQGVAPLDVNPNQMFLGPISEIHRYGIVTSAVKRARAENSTIIYAYTWEGDHFKRWKLAEFPVDEKNAIFDKYLKDGKRTQVTVQQIKP